MSMLIKTHISKQHSICTYSDTLGFKVGFNKVMYRAERHIQYLINEKLN